MMSRFLQRTIILIVMVFFFSLSVLFAQDRGSTLVFLEGEDAATTNFNKEPIYNYHCSGGLTLQLSTTVELKKENRYYAEFVLTVPADGEYELWYGGTPPGPGDFLLPGYFSPFTIQFDDDEEVTVYREDVNVVERYTAGYYWIKTGSFELTEGIHTLKFYVDSMRNFDKRYYFYLDCFFLIKKKEIDMWSGFEKPQLFVEDPFNRDIDTPYQSIEDYEDWISRDETNIKPVIDLAEIHYHTQNYIKSIKYYRIGLLLEPENPDYYLMVAKNYIWLGDVDTGLELLVQYLKDYPGNVNVWKEAAKLCAWNGKYEEAAFLYKEAIEYFPDDIDLKINLGINYLWASQEFDANRTFDKVKDEVGEDFEFKMDIALIYYKNQYLMRAISEFEDILKDNPQVIEPYIYLNEIYTSLKKPEEAEKILGLMEENIQDAERIEEVKNEIYAKQMVREVVIRRLKDILELEPEDLHTRYILAQTYYWNKMQEEAIYQYEKILETELFYKIKEIEEENLDLDNQYTYKSALESFLVLYLNVLEQIKKEADEIKSEFDSINSKEIQLEKELESKSGILSQKQGELESLKEGFIQNTPEDETDSEEKQDDEKTANEIKKLEQEIAALESEIQGIEKEINNQNQLKEETVESSNKLASKLDFINIKIKEILDINTINDNKLIGIFSEKEVRREIFLRALEPTDWEWDENDFYGRLDASIKQDNSPLSMQIKSRALFWQGSMEKAGEILDSVFSEDQEARVKNNFLESMIGNKEESGDIINFIQKYESEMIQYNPEIEDIKNLYLNYAVLIYPSETEKKWHNFESAVAGLDFAVEGLNNTIAVINDKLESIKEDKEKILTVLYGELEKGIFEYEQDSVPRYNEIGDFYYKNKKLEEAIYYYQKVLSIEPNNINAIYYLGTIFEQNNEWYRASENYKLAFKLDPAYYQAASKYNQVTERHPRLLKNDFTFYIEPSYSTFEEKLSIETHINQVLGIRAHYIYIHRTEKLSLNKDVDEFPVTFNNPLLRIGIDYQELQYGMPVNIKNKIVLTPYARIGLAGLYSGYDVIQDEDWEIVDNYFNFKLAGGGGLIAELPFRYVVPGFSVDVYAQPETMRPFFKTVYYIKGQVKLVTNFSFWNFYPFREITMLNNIDFYYNFDGKMELDTYNEINYNIVNLAEIGFLLGLRLDATYETKLPTDTPVPETYWMPDGELSYGARLGISEDFEKIRPPIRLEVYGYIGHVITNLNTDSISYLRWKTGGSLYWDISYLTLGFTIDYISTDSFKHTDLSYSSMSISIKAVLRFPDVIKF